MYNILFRSDEMDKTELAIKFFIARFGIERIAQNPDYLAVWIKRFNDGFAEASMDSKSIMIYKKM